MRRDASATLLSVVLVDYDNLYLSLKRKSEDAAKRFAKDAASWVRELQTGALITSTGGMAPDVPRRLVMNRCYGNPVPRRNASDSSTDMSSFPFVRHHFLRSGFEVIDCPPLTAQLKNSSDIRMVMDINDLIGHRTEFDEFIILSSDADFTPVLHRLRAYARRTVIYANDSTVAPYTAIADGEVREADLLTLLTGGKLGATETPAAVTGPSGGLGELKGQIIAEVARIVREAPAPVPLETLAERTTRALGHDRTVGSGWAGAGSFRELLIDGLPEDVQLTEQPPYLAFDRTRLAARETPAIAAPQARPSPQPAAPVVAEPTMRAPQQPQVSAQPQLPMPAPQPRREQPAPSMPAPGQALVPAQPAAVQPAISQPVLSQPVRQPVMQPAAPPQASAAPSAPRSGVDMATQIQNSIARIHDACQAPPLAPPEYRMVFEILAREIATNQLQGVHTINNVIAQARDMRLELKREDVRFILDVVSEADPWFEQGATANLFAGRFRNFVVQRCRTQGLNLSVDELDLIDAWFTGGTLAVAQQAASERQPAPQAQPQTAVPQKASPIPAEARDWWANEDRMVAAGGGAMTAPAQRYEQPVQYGQPAAPSAAQPGTFEDDFPRIVRSRLRG